MRTLSNNTNNTVKTSKLGFTVAGAALALGAGLFSAPAASAQITFTLLNDLSETKNVSISANSGGSFFVDSVGRFHAKINGGPTINAWCNDLNHGVSFGQSFTANMAYRITDPIGSLTPTTNGYYQGGLASGLVNGDYTTVSSSAAVLRAAASAFLADTYINTSSFASVGSGSTDLLTNLAALQLATWDLIQDGGDGVSAGTFRVGGADNATYSSLVGFYETQALAAAAGGYTNSRAMFVQSQTTFSGGTYSHLQNFTVAVPEPGPVAMLIGAGMAGMFGLRFKKRNRK